MATRAMVTSVDVDSDAKRVYVSAIAGPNNFYNDILFTQPAPGIWVVPEEKDIVEVYERADGRFAARTAVHEETFFPENLSEGDKVVVADDGAGFYIERKPDDSHKIRIQDAGNNIQIVIDNGNVEIDGIDFSSHTHDYTWTDAAGSGTTDPPQ